MQTMFMRRKEKDVKQAKYNLRLDQALLESVAAKARSDNKSVNLFINELIVREIREK